MLASIATMLGNLDIVHWNQGHLDKAIVHFTQPVACHQEIGDKRSVGIQLGNLGAV